MCLILELQKKVFWRESDAIEGGRGEWSLVWHSEIMICCATGSPGEGLSRAHQELMGCVYVSVLACVS